jgi:hypothetical protein
MKYSSPSLSDKRMLPLLVTSTLSSTDKEPNPIHNKGPLGTMPFPPRALQPRQVQLTDIRLFPAHIRDHNAFLHLNTYLQRSVFMEFNVSSAPILNTLCNTLCSYSNDVQVPQGPGLGVEVNESQPKKMSCAFVQPLISLLRLVLHHQH